MRSQGAGVKGAGVSWGRQVSATGSVRKRRRDERRLVGVGGEVSDSSSEEKTTDEDGQERAHQRDGLGWAVMGTKSERTNGHVQRRDRGDMAGEGCWSCRRSQTRHVLREDTRLAGVRQRKQRWS